MGSGGVQKVVQPVVHAVVRPRTLVVHRWCIGGAPVVPLVVRLVALFKGKMARPGELLKGLQGKAEASLAGTAKDPIGFWRKRKLAPPTRSGI